MKKLLLLGIATVALTAAGPVQAQLTLSGECGLVRTMNANALPPMTLAAAADYVGSEDTFIPVRVEFGVIDGLEIGANYWYLDNKNVDSILGFNAKYRLPLDLVEGLGIAAGANYQITSVDKGDDMNVLKLTGVASFDVPAGAISLQPSAGLVYERQSNGDSESGLRFFANLMAMVMPNLGIGGEFMTAVDKLDGDGADPSLWFGARYMALENLSVQAGVMNNADFGGSDPSDWVFNVGAGYAFNLGM